MIVEHEVISFAAEEPRLLGAIHELIVEFGRPEPAEVVRGLVRGGWAELCNSKGVALDPWKSAEILRAGRLPSDVYILATQAGLEWGYS